MSSRIIGDSETDVGPTLVFSGDLLEIDAPGSLLTPAILAQNGATFTMTAGTTLTATGSPDMTPSNGSDALFINGSASIVGAVVHASGATVIGNTYNGAAAAQGTGGLTVSGGATVTDTDTIIGDWNVFGQDKGSLVLIGPGTKWQDTGDPNLYALYGSMQVGGSGIGSLVIQSGATATENTFAAIGNNSADAKGDVFVDGAGSAWNIGTNLVIGGLGTGTLTVSNKAKVSVGVSAALGYDAGGSGSVTIDSGATLAATSKLFVGYHGTGTLSVKNGGMVTADQLLVAAYADSGSAALTSSITIDGKNSALNIATDAFVGNASPVPDMPPDFINGQFGKWVYSPSGFGGILVQNGGYLSIGNSLGLQESDDKAAPVSFSVLTGGSAEIGGNSGWTPDTMTIDSGGRLAGHGHVVVGDVVGSNFVNHSLVNNGLLLAQDGTLIVGANVTGTGTLEIDQDATADIYGDFTGNVQFNGAYATTLRLEQPDDNDFKGTLSDLQIGDVISLADSALPGNEILSHTQINGSSLELTFQDGTIWNYNLDSAYSGDTFTIRDRTVNGSFYTELTLQPVNPKIVTEISGQPTADTEPYIDSLVWGWGQWDPSKGPITYWFGGPNDVKPAVLAHGETTELGPDTMVDIWNSDEQAAFLSGVGAYDSVSPLRFQTASSADTADVIWWLKPGLSDPKALGLSDVPAQVPGGPLWQFFADTRWLNDPDQLAFGGDGENTVIHELGHALGLAHPTDGGYEPFPDGTAFPAEPSDPQDQAVFTVMSINQGWDGVLRPPGVTKPPLEWGTQGGLGALDIGAIQTLYGKNMSTGAGDTPYPLPTDNMVGTGWKAIWDPSGFNTISNKGSSKPSHIDLRAAPLIGPDAGGYPSYVVGVEGGFTIANGTEIDGAIGGTGNDVFQTNSGPDVIDGVGGQDTVIFSRNLSAYSLSRSGNTVTVTLGSITDTLQNIYQLNFADQNVFVANIACFAEGTLIATDRGEIAVEALRLGDRVLTLAGETHKPLPVTWIGRRRIDLTAHPRPETVAPVRIQRGAFADNIPHRDLLLSPDHAVFVDGKLICVRQLANGTTIRPEPGWTAVDYYHVELDEHAILLAEGLTVESYLDTGNRGFFSNSGMPLVLHPDLTNETDYPTREAGSCAPFVSDEASVQPVWQHLADRAAISRQVPPRATTTDADLRLLANRRTVKPVFSDSDRVVFVLPRGAHEVRLVSRAQSPTEARPWLEDRRRLGVRVKRIVLRGADETREVPVDHPDLTRGWWGVERDGQKMSRWTDGEAVLPLPAIRGDVMLEIHLAGSMTYAVDAVREERCAA